MISRICKVFYNKKKSGYALPAYSVQQNYQHNLSVNLRCVCLPVSQFICYACFSLTGDQPWQVWYQEKAHDLGKV